MNNISPLKLLVLLKQSEIENPEKISNFVEKYLKFVFMVFEGFLFYGFRREKFLIFKRIKGPVTPLGFRWRPPIFLTHFLALFTLRICKNFLCILKNVGFG